MNLRTIIICSLLLFTLGCRKDTPEEKNEKTPSGNGVFISNEGNFGRGTATLSFYKYEDKTLTEDVFQMVNQRPLGDVCQSLTFFNDKAYVVVNNSNKIEIINPADYKSLGVIKGLISPRYFLGINPSKAYVTDYLSNYISVIDLNTNKKTKEIPCKGWTEELVLANNKAFVTNLRNEYVYVINTSTDKIEDSIKVTYSPIGIRTDKNGKLWILCNGSKFRQTKGSLERINPVTNKIELSLPFTNQTDSIGTLDINGTRDTLYYLNKGVNQFPIGKLSLPSSPLIPQNKALFYGLGIEPKTGTIYISDAIDYVQKGLVFRYRPDGKLIDSFNAGIIPNDFYFYSK